MPMKLCLLGEAVRRRGTLAHQQAAFLDCKTSADRHTPAGGTAAMQRWTWFEWSLEESTLLKTLVVEVEFDTDPNNPQCRRNVLDAIKGIQRGACWKTIPQ
jgi:hypothetical protein